MKKKIRKIFIILSLIILFSIYMLYNSSLFSFDITNEIIKSCNNDYQECIVDITNVTTFDWDDMYVFADSTDNNQVSEIIGFEYNNPAAKYHRKILFIMNDEVVYEDLFFSDSFENPKKGSAYYNYPSDLPPFYIHLTSDNALMSVKDKNGYLNLGLVK